MDYKKVLNNSKNLTFKIQIRPPLDIRFLKN